MHIRSWYIRLLFQWDTKFNSYEYSEFGISLEYPIELKHTRQVEKYWKYTL